MKCAKCDEPPTHIFLQAEWRFSCIHCNYMRKYFGNDPKIIIVEPTKAPVLLESINKGEAVTVTGGVSNMGRLDCKSPSIRALSSLAITCTNFMTIEDEDADIAVEELRQNEFDTSPSGGAGYAAIKEAKKYPE